MVLVYLSFQKEIYQCKEWASIPYKIRFKKIRRLIIIGMQKVKCREIYVSRHLCFPILIAFINSGSINLRIDKLLVYILG